MNSGDRARPPLWGRARAFVRSLAAPIDWMADPRGRVYKWLTLFGLLVGGAAALVTLLGDPEPPEPPSSQPAALDVSADIPVIEGWIGHTSSDPTGSLLEDYLKEGEVVELHLKADAAEVTSLNCRKNLLNPCSVTWALSCDEGYSPPDTWILEEVDVSYTQYCSPVLSIAATSQERGGPDWVYAHGVLSLDGFFVVDGIGYAQGILTARMREIPVETARQLLR